MSETAPPPHAEPPPATPSKPRPAKPARPLSGSNTASPASARRTPAKGPRTPRQRARPAAEPRATGLGRTAQAIDLLADVGNHTLAANPLIGLRPADLASAAGSLLRAVRQTPDKAGRHLASYGRALLQIVRGTSQIAPHPRDKRFADPA